MGLDFTPLMVLAFAGIGAMLGALFVPLFALTAWFFPAMAPYVFAPVLAGMVGGFIAGVALK